MSIQTELTRITNAKAAIKTAIEGKGVTVPAGTLLDGMASLIESIEAGGDSGGVKIATATFTVAEDTSTPFVITHNLGSIPKIAICMREILSTSGFHKESFVKGELLFSYAVNGEKKGRAYQMSGTSYSAGVSLAVAMYNSTIGFTQNTESNLNGSSIGGCTKTTAMLKPAYNSGAIFAAGKPYRWILISTGDAV